MTDKKSAILKTVERLTDNYRNEELFMARGGRCLPSRDEIIAIIKELRAVVFPGYFGNDSCSMEFPEYFAGSRLNALYDRLRTQIGIAFSYFSEEDEDTSVRADEVTASFFESLPQVQELLLKDVQAGFDGDPAAKSKEEIIFSYPGLYAIYVYRLAHVLYLEKVPFIPRIMTEHAHSRTGIDINPGATIGEYFFIDHGTGVVIGETTVIGNYVKLYQGVTLGALSTRMGQALANIKRHPTIGDHVTIYANSTVLGGDTVIGANSIVAGNTFITASIDADTKVSTKSPELVIKNPRKKAAEKVWFWEI
ncbi:MAG: serine acetyltransferase [Blautia sp.]|nr:serine acetyltransferase [Blautia sp.]